MVKDSIGGDVHIACGAPPNSRKAPIRPRVPVRHLRRASVGLLHPVDGSLVGIRARVVALLMVFPIRGRFVVAHVAAPDPLKAPAVARVAVGHGLGAAVDGHGHVAERKRDRLGNVKYHIYLVNSSYVLSFIAMGIGICIC